jgi:hypothetical protein
MVYEFNKPDAASRRGESPNRDETLSNDSGEHRRGFYQRGSGPRWKLDRPYHVTLEHSYIQPHWDEIAICLTIRTADRETDPNTLSVHQHNLGTLFAALYPAQKKTAGPSRGVCNASIDNLAGRSEPPASLSGPWPQGLAPVSSRCAVAVRFWLGRCGGAKPTVPGNEQLLSVVCRFSCPGCQRSGWAKSAAGGVGEAVRYFMPNHNIASASSSAPNWPMTTTSSSSASR